MFNERLFGNPGNDFRKAAELVLYFIHNLIFPTAIDCSTGF